MSGAASITVVIPTLDEERTIGACLDSIGCDPEVSVVVSDGGSCDATVTRAAGRAQVTVVTGHRGRGRQLNRGAGLATGRLLLFLHADCRLPAGWRAPLEAALADPGTALACYRLHTEPSAQGAGGLARAWLRLLDLRSFGLGLPYGDQGFGLRRSLFEELGGFQEIPLMEDLALAGACRRLGRIRRLRLEVRTTARRFEQRPGRARIMTVTFPWLFRLGVSGERLARWYGQAR